MFIKAVDSAGKPGYVNISACEAVYLASSLDDDMKAIKGEFSVVASSVSRQAVVFTGTMEECEEELNRIMSRLPVIPERKVE